jgi:hypothetical protein
MIQRDRSTISVPLPALPLIPTAVEAGLNGFVVTTIKSDLAKYTRVIKTANIKLEQ